MSLRCPLSYPLAFLRKPNGGGIIEAEKITPTMRFHSTSLLTTLVCLVFAPAAAPLAFAQEAAPPAKTTPQAEKARQEILARLNQISKEQSDKTKEPGVVRSAAEVAYAFKYYTKDYVCILANGQKKSSAELQSDMESLFSAGCQAIRPQFDISGITTKGNTATVESSFKSILEMRRSDGITMNLENTGRGRDFWIKTGGQWFLKRSRVIETNMKAEGQPAPQ